MAIFHNFRAHISFARSFVVGIASKWRGAPPLQVIETTNSLPFSVPSDVRGMFMDGQAYVVAAQPAHRLAQTLTHEVIGHHGIRQVLRHRLGAFLRGVAETARKAKTGKLRRLHDMVRRNYVDHKGRCRLPVAVIAEEMAAYEVEDLTCPATGELRRPRSKRRITFAKVREMLWRPERQHRFDYHHLLAVIHAATKLVRTGVCQSARRIRSLPGAGAAKCMAAMRTKVRKQPARNWRR